MFFVASQGGREAVRAQADELPGAHAPLRLGRCARTATCRSATPSRRRSTATSSPAPCTGSCASGTSPRTTPTSSARPDQIEAEIFGCLDFASYLYDLFGLTARFELSTRPEKKVGTDEEWDFTEGALRAALERRGIEYAVNEGDGAFYGPKIDLHMTDVLGRSWQMGTIQLDAINAAAVRPHLHGRQTTRSTRRTSSTARCSARSSGSSASSSSTTRGAFPFWLAPVQVRVLPVGEAPPRGRARHRREPARRRLSGRRRASRPRRSASGSARRAREDPVHDRLRRPRERREPRHPRAGRRPVAGIAWRISSAKLATLAS